MRGTTDGMNQGSRLIQLYGLEFHKKKQERKPTQTDQRVILKDTSWAQGTIGSRASNSVKSWSPATSDRRSAVILRHLVAGPHQHFCTGDNLPPQGYIHSED